jgi:hypothetical protein
MGIKTTTITVMELDQGVVMSLFEDGDQVGDINLDRAITVNDAWSLIHGISILRDNRMFQITQEPSPCGDDDYSCMNKAGG